MTGNPIGLLWYDKNDKKSTDDIIREGEVHAKQKLSIAPTVVYVCERQFLFPFRVEDSKLIVVPVGHVLPNHYLFCDEEIK